MGLFAFFKKRLSDDGSEPSVVPVDVTAAPEAVSAKPVIRPKPVIKPAEDPLGFLDNPELEIEVDGS